jgi:hypothetical protein
LAFSEVQQSPGPIPHASLALNAFMCMRSAERAHNTPR